jgi:hypothetical protein
MMMNWLLVNLPIERVIFISLIFSLTGLAERRQRKRTKRIITQGLNIEDSEEEAESKSVQEKARKGKQVEEMKKPKIPAGFALMHGFAATNVGKNRLTVRY